MLLFRFLCLALLAVLAGCAARPRPGPPIVYKTGPACMAELGELQVAYTPAPSVGNGSCRVAAPLRVDSAGTIDWNRGTLVACPLAAAMAAFSREVIQQEALRRFGTIVVRIDHLGTWSCRHRSSNRWRMSRHAQGLAIDVAGFELADGRVIRVAEDWSGSGAKREFLHALARRACAYFNVVLTPDSDSDHENHFHLDVGPERSCRP